LVSYHITTWCHKPKFYEQVSGRGKSDYFEKNIPGTILSLTDPK